MNITENGSYSIVPNGIDEMDIDVDVPISKIQPTRNIIYNTNNVYSITPDTGYDAISDVKITVNVFDSLYQFCGVYINDNHVLSASSSHEVSIPPDNIIMYSLYNDTDNSGWLYIARNTTTEVKTVSNVKKYMLYNYSSGANVNMWINIVHGYSTYKQLISVPMSVVPDYVDASKCIRLHLSSAYVNDTIFFTD